MTRSIGFRYAALILLGLFAGCSILPKEPEPKTYFVLEADPQSAPHFDNSVSKSLLIGATTAGIFINSPRILFGNSPETRSFYQYSLWTEAPTIQFTRLLLGKFEHGNAFKTVSRASVGAIGDYQLNTEIKELYQDRTVSPPVARLIVAADMVKMVDRRILASRTFSEVVKLDHDNASGAVHAFSTGSNKIMNDIVTWSVGVVPRSEPASKAADDETAVAE